MPLTRESCRASLNHRWGRQTAEEQESASNAATSSPQLPEPRHNPKSRPSTSLSAARPEGGRDEWQLPRLSINKNHLPTTHAHQPRRSLQVLRDRAGNFHRSSSSHNHYPSYDEDEHPHPHPRPRSRSRPLSRQRSKTPSSPEPNPSQIPTLPSPRTLSTIPTDNLQASLTAALASLQQLESQLDSARATVRAYGAMLNAVQAQHLAVLTRSDPEPGADRELVRLRDQRDELIGIQEGNLGTVGGLEEGVREGRGVVGGLRGELGRRGFSAAREGGVEGDEGEDDHGGGGRSTREGQTDGRQSGLPDAATAPLRAMSKNTPARKGVLKPSKTSKKFDVLGFPASDSERCSFERREVLHTFLR